VADFSDNFLGELNPRKGDGIAEKMGRVSLIKGWLNGYGKTKNHGEARFAV
jgi:hypothetical protein